MRGIGQKVFQKGADDAVSRLWSGKSEVTRSLYGFRFWAAQVAENVYDIYAMTDAAYKAGVINGERVGSIRETNRHTYYTLEGGEEVMA